MYMLTAFSIAILCRGINMLHDKAQTMRFISCQGANFYS